MLKATYSVLWISLLSVLFSCAGGSQDSDGLPSIKLAEAYADSETPLASDYFQSIEYIRVETSDATLAMRMDAAYILSDTTLLVEAFRKIIVVDRRSGNLVKEIGHYGDDPNAYRATLRFYGVDETKPITYTMGLKDDFAEYSLVTGQKVGSVKKPRPDDFKPFESEMILGAFTRIDDTTFIGFTKNYNGKQKTRLVIFKPDGQIVKTYPNYLSYVDDPDKYVSWGNDEAAFFKNQDKLFFKEYFNDTVYQVDTEKMEPVYHFDLSLKSPPYSDRETMDLEERKNYMFVKKPVDTEQLLFFQVSHRDQLFVGVYDKAEKETRLSRIEENGVIERHGIQNDIHDFIPIYPTTLQNGLVVGLTPAEEAYAWFKNNPDKIASLPISLQQLKNIEPEDNPIVTIARLK